MHTTCSRAPHAQPMLRRLFLGDMNFTRADVPRVARTGRADMTTRASQHVATQTPQRTPWLT